MNGPNEPIQFTREDAARLVRIEGLLKNLNGIKDQVVRNTTWLKAIRWIFPSVITLMIISKFFGF